MSEFNRLEFRISYVDGSWKAPVGHRRGDRDGRLRLAHDVVVEASWFDAEGEECSDYSTAAADNPSDGLTMAVAWLEENCGVTTSTSEALSAACEALRQIGEAS